jgi:AcrR family transcriptional regulator
MQSSNRNPPNVLVPTAVKTTKSVPRRRDRGETEKRILDSVARVLARDGFAEIGVNAVAKEASVDKVLIYRYFGGLPELLAAYGASGQFWPSVDELLGPEDTAPTIQLAEQLSVLLARFIASLRKRPLTIEILAWETVTRNELTAVLETVREDWGHALSNRLGRQYPGGKFDAAALMIIFTAAIQYFLVRARTIRIYGGIELRKDAGWQRLHRAMTAALAAVLPPQVEQKKRLTKGHSRRSEAA